MKKHPIQLKKVRVHNLQGVDLELNSGELILFTGVSGSGKSSMAFDTIYSEGQRLYIESLSTFARRYMGQFERPDVERISGLSPTIAIEQKSAGKNPRSTVGTLTEIYDYMRVLFARVATAYCPLSGERVTPESSERIIKKLQALPSTKAIFLAPFAKGKKGEFKEDLQHFLRKGFLRARVDGTIMDLDEEVSLDKNVSHDIEIVIDRFTLSKENHSRIAEAVLSSLDIGQGLFTLLDAKTNKEILFSTHAYSAKSDRYYNSLEPQDFSFNTPSGMCDNCAGLGRTQEFDLDLVIDADKSIAEDCCSIASSYATVRFGNIYDNLAALYKFDVHTPWKDLPKKAREVFLYGVKKKWIKMHFVHPIRKTSWTDYVPWKGVIFEAKKRYMEATSDLYRKKAEKLMKMGPCSSCKGSRLAPYPAAAKLGGKAIHEISALPIEEALPFFETLKLDPNDQKIAEELLKEITRRLHFLLDVGLHYLCLDRTSPTLSGGEAQRVRLASQVGSALVGITYVLDEPSIGLHPRDNKKLITTLKHLRDVGNTVIVVEHDEETIREADRVIDFGPGPGEKGGEILVNGSFQDLLKHPTSLTAQYLRGDLKIDRPSSVRKPGEEHLLIKGARHHNLQNIDVKIPLGLFVAITGVSGSGKSSLISDTLVPALAQHHHRSEQPIGAHDEIVGKDEIHKIIAIDQSPIGRTPRSNSATYIKIFDEIRALFCKLPESQARGYQVGRFSFNVADGSCSQCSGMGQVRIDMDFMEDQWTTCTLCHGQRFDHETLSVRYKGKNIHEVLEMSVGEALDFFQNIPTLKRKLTVLSQVGMDYIRLGQPSTTLSGGEAQRIKLAKELVRPPSGKTLYILDEPTTGLHFHDVNALLKVLQNLVDRGNSMIIIEHHIDLIKSADWIIDLGPEGGNGGGQIVAEGPPKKIMKMKGATADALREVFQQKEEKKRAPTQKIDQISVKGAAQNNLKQIDAVLPRGQISICTGPSGSGKSSLAMDTIYAEGQRSYIESLSPYARQFVKQCPKPKVAQIEGLSPAIAIEQKTTAGNPRSTVGTMTEIYDYLRILFARAGTAYCPETGEKIKSINKETICEAILAYPEGEKITLLAPLTLQKHEEIEDLCSRFAQKGFLRVRLDKTVYELDEKIPFDRKRKQDLALVIDRLKVSPQIRSRLFEAIENATAISDGKVLVAREKEDQLFNLSFAVESTGRSYSPITPHSFSFNSSEGMCPECQGLGTQFGADFSHNEEIMNLSIKGLLRHIWARTDVALFSQVPLNPKLRLKDLTPEELHLLLFGGEWMQTKGFSFKWLGIGPPLAKAAKHAHRQIRLPLTALLKTVPCPACSGTRLHALARHVKLQNHTMGSLCAEPIEELFAFIQALPRKDPVLDEVFKQLEGRLEFLIEVGLHYLSLDRPAPTLSNGEAQRIRLARQLGSKLTGVLYVLDEPTIGLHPKDNEKLNSALLKLKDLGNTLVMVEHDPLTLQIADKILDFGPQAGAQGGHLMAQGTLEQLKKNPQSLTGQYLSGKKSIPIPEKRRKAQEHFPIQNAHIHNLKNLTFDLPLGIMTCLTGVSGSGKSTLMHNILVPALKPEGKLIVIDQNPIGHTARADVGTYTDLLSPMRTFFSSLADAKTRGLKPRAFSYNHKKGMCTTCYGMGYKKIEMLFLPSVRITCDQCHGNRLNPVSLAVTYQNMNFGQLLNLTVEQLRAQFPFLRKVKRICDTLISVGLGYLTLGQEIATLSGGEAQRMKLSRDLSSRTRGRTFYLLDEPTTGLHPDDVKKLLELLHRLVDKGHTMVIIEHNLDIIKSVDWILELGPEAGDKGGELLFQGTPENLAQCKRSSTAPFLGS